MIIHDYSNEKSLLQKYVAELRSHTIQKDAWRFRQNIERIGSVLAYEMSKTLLYTEEEIRSPFGIVKMQLPQDNLVVGAILRAGLPLHRGVLSCFDSAESLFISAYRQRQEDGSIKSITEYLAAPDLTGKTLVLCDPMIATGTTLCTVFDILKNRNNLDSIHIISVIGSEDGLSQIKQHFPEDTHLWITAIDRELSDKKYIIPGLGDAGDLCFGIKH